MVQQQLPSATSHFSPQVEKGADQTHKVGQRTTSSSTTLTTRCAPKQCTSPSEPCQEIAPGHPGRPQLPSGALFAWNFTGEQTGLVTCLTWRSSSVCRV